MYLVVLDIRKKDKLNSRVEYWLQLINSYNKFRKDRISIVFALSYDDELDEEANEKIVLKLTTMINHKSQGRGGGGGGGGGGGSIVKGIVNISCKTSHQIDELKDMLLDITKERLNTLKGKIKNEWIILYDKIKERSQTKGLMKWDELLYDLKLLKIPSIELPDLLDFLCESGAIIYYYKDLHFNHPTLKNPRKSFKINRSNVIIINLPWFASVINQIHSYSFPSTTSSTPSTPSSPSHRAQPTSPPSPLSNTLPLHNDLSPLRHSLETPHPSSTSNE